MNIKTLNQILYAWVITSVTLYDFLDSLILQIAFGLHKSLDFFLGVFWVSLLDFHSGTYPDYLEIPKKFSENFTIWLYALASGVIREKELMENLKNV